MFLLPSPTSHREEDAARGAQTSGQTPIEGSSSGKVVQRGLRTVASLGKLGDVGGDSGVSCSQDASFLAPL